MFYKLHAAILWFWVYLHGSGLICVSSAVLLGVFRPLSGSINRSGLSGFKEEGLYEDTTRFLRKFIVLWGLRCRFPGLQGLRSGSFRA